jgi:bla regulator protein BlaR1
MTAALVNHLWQSTLVAALAWLVTMALRRDRAGVRYGVWLAASLKFLVPFSMFTALGERFGVRPVVVASFMPYQVMLDATGGAMISRAVRFPSVQPAAVPLAHRIGLMLPDLLLGLWALGAAALLTAWLVRWRRVAAVVRVATPLTGGTVHDALRRLEASAGITRPLTIVESAGSLEPGVFGINSPTLVWPSRIDAHLSEEQIDAILAHEIMHVRRRDNLAAAAHMAVQAAFWFHPLVWWLGIKLIDERERACDEAVLGAGRAPHAYAESILKTCQLLVESPLACVSGVTGSELKQRIEHIMTNEIRPDLNAWKKSMLAVAAAAAIALPFVAGVMTVQAQQIGVLGPGPATGTGAGGEAAFDVTSVKPNNSGSGMIRMVPAGNGGMQAENVTVGMLVRMANQLQDNQIVGGPKWLFEDRYDIVGTGTAPGRPGTPLEKFKTLLADRFKLVTHMETREQSMFTLVLARKDGKLGDKMTASTADCTPTGPNGRGRGPVPPPSPGERPTCGSMFGPGRLRVGGQSMAAFAQSLSRFVGGIVVDKTGLSGTYDIELTYSPDPNINAFGRDLPPQPGVPPPAANPDAPSLFSALQEQLGLKLEATKGQVDVLVIDSAEKPAAD